MVTRLIRFGVLCAVAVLLSGCLGLGTSKDKAMIASNISVMQQADSASEMLSYLRDPIQVQISLNLDDQLQELQSITLTHNQLSLGYYGGNIPGNIIDLISKEQDGRRLIKVDGNIGSTVQTQGGRFGVVRDDQLVAGRSVENIIETLWEKEGEQWYMYKILITVNVESPQ